MDSTAVGSKVPSQRTPASQRPTGDHVGVIADGAGAEPPRRAAGWARRWAPALGPGLLMLLLALIGATRPVLSWDEVATADAAGRSAAEIWRLAQTVDAVFAPYYLFMHLWTSVFGATDLTLRLPSIIAMSGAAAMTGELGRRMFGPVIGTVGALLLCLMPNASRYAGEARPYAFASFFALLALVLLLRALHRPGVAAWVAYGAAVLLTGMSHLIALTTLAAHVPLLLQHRHRAGFRGTVLRWASSAGAAVVLLLPLLWRGLHQRDDQLSWVAEPNLGTVYKFPADVVGSATGAWLLLGLALVALRYPMIRHVGVLLVMALVPVAVLLAVSLIVASFWVPRYFLVVLAPLALVAAVGLLYPLPERAGGARRRAVTLGARILPALLVVGLVMLPDQVRVRGTTAKNGSDYRGAAAIIARDRQPGDVLVHETGSRHLRPGLNHYLRSVPDRPPDVLMERSAAEVGRLRAQEYRDPVARVRGTPRVWLVVHHQRRDATTGRRDLRPLLTGEYRQARMWHLNRTTLALYVRRDRAA